MELEQLASVLPAHLVRPLGDSHYDKRKAAAHEVQDLVKTWNFGQWEQTRTQSLIEHLALATRSSNANARKGCLTALAAVAFGLLESEQQKNAADVANVGGNVSIGNDNVEVKHLTSDDDDGGQHMQATTSPTSRLPSQLKELVRIMLDAFNDPDARVRFYACEALFNISCLSRAAILTHLYPIFDGLGKLFNDVDVEVKGGANLLDRLMKDIVVENAAAFDMRGFAAHLYRQKYFHSKNPHVRNLVIGWILLLHHVPAIDALDCLPAYLNCVFNMLSDRNTAIKNKADDALVGFLEQIRLQPTDLDFETIVPILEEQAHSQHALQRLTSLIWVDELIRLGHERLAPIALHLLEIVNHRLSDPEGDVAEMAHRANNQLRLVVQSMPSDIDGKWGPSQMDQLARNLKQHLGQQGLHPMLRESAMKWLAMLIGKAPGIVEQHLDGLLPALLLELLDLDLRDSVVTLDIEVLAQMCRFTSETSDRFMRVLKQLLAKFARHHAKLLEQQPVGNACATASRDSAAIDAGQQYASFWTRMAMVVRQLCVKLDATEVYVHFATAIREVAVFATAPPAPPTSPGISNRMLFRRPSYIDVEDADEFGRLLGFGYEFASLTITNLNVVLLTAPELKNLRDKLRSGFSCTCRCCCADANFQVVQDGKTKQFARDTFAKIFETWCHSAVAAFSLCLFSQAYELAGRLLECFGTMDKWVGLVSQLDKVVLLFESPAFAHVRLQLLEPSCARFAALCSTLRGLMLLLPTSSSAHMMLRKRLDSACALTSRMHSSNGESDFESNTAVQRRSSHADERVQMFDKLANCFASIQAQHGQNRSWGTRQVSSSQPQLLKCTVVTIKPHDRTPDDSNDALEVGPAEKEINIGAEQDNIAGPTPDGNGGGNDNGCNTVLARALVAGNEQPIADASVPQTEPDPYC